MASQESKDIALERRLGGIEKNTALTMQSVSRLEEQIANISKDIKEVPSRTEFDSLKEEVEGKVGRGEVYAVIGTITLIATIIGIISNVIRITI
jgi:hypothetical protein